MHNSQSHQLLLPSAPCLVLSCLVLSCLVLSCFVLSCLALSCPVLSCLVLSLLVLSCLVLACILTEVVEVVVGERLKVTYSYVGEFRGAAGGGMPLHVDNLDNEYTLAIDLSYTLNGESDDKGAVQY